MVVNPSKNRRKKFTGILVYPFKDVRGAHLRVFGAGHDVIAIAGEGTAAGARRRDLGSNIILRGPSFIGSKFK